MPGRRPGLGNDHRCRFSSRSDHILEDEGREVEHERGVRVRGVGVLRFRREDLRQLMVAVREADGPATAWREGRGPLVRVLQAAVGVPALIVLVVVAHELIGH